MLQIGIPFHRRELFFRPHGAMPRDPPVAFLIKRVHRRNIDSVLSLKIQDTLFRIGRFSTTASPCYYMKHF